MKTKSKIVMIIMKQNIKKYKKINKKLKYYLIISHNKQICQNLIQMKENNYLVLLIRWKII